MLLIGLAPPLALFNAPFVSWLQQRHDVAEVGFDGRQDIVERVTGGYIGDLWSDGDFDATAGTDGPLLDARARSHMRDVSRLVRLLGVVTALAAAAAIGAGWIMRSDRRRIGRLLLVSAAVVGVAGMLMAVVFAVAFDAAFLAFHALFFPPDSYLFAPGSPLIRLFPPAFWFDAALIAGAVVVLAALVVALVGWRMARPAHAA